MESGTGAILVSKHGQLISIQILRAVAALAVLVHHTLFEISFHVSGRGVAQKVLVGAAGVDLFFVISGFVMVYSSAALFGKPGAPGLFLLRRIVRVVPLYWAVTTLLLLYPLLRFHYLLPEIQTWPGVIASYLFYPYPSPAGPVAPLHGLGWTLNYEMFFYAVFTAAIILPAARAVAIITSIFIVLVVIGRLFALPQPFKFWFDPMILEFCFGMLIALVYGTGWRIPFAASAALVIAVIAAFTASALWGQNVPWRVLEWGVPCAVLVAACVLCRDSPHGGTIARAFGFLGDASYSLYLVHPFAILVLRKTVERWIDFKAFPWAYAPVLIAASIAAAIATYIFFERPITRALQRRIKGKGGQLSFVAP